LIESESTKKTPLGNDVFREKIERKMGIKVGYAKRGRPFKKPE